MEEAALAQDQRSRQHHADVCAVLRETREGFGKTLADVERTLRIRECQLKAIEDGDISKLPGRVYAIGFVRTYAEYLGLDGGEVVRQFKAQYMGAQPREVLEFPIHASETKTPPIWLAVILIGFVMIGGVAWSMYNRTDRSIVTHIPSAPASIPQDADIAAPDARPLASSPTTSQVISQTNSQTTGDETQVEDGGNAAVDGLAAQEEDSQEGIILNIIENSWVEIKDGDGKVIVSNVLKTGDQYFVPDNPGMTMSIGNAGGVEIVLNGRVMKPLGKSGDIRRDIPLDTDYLKTLEFKQDQPADGKTKSPKEKE